MSSPSKPSCLPALSLEICFSGHMCISNMARRNSVLQHSGTEMVLVRCTSRKDIRVIQVDLAHIVGLVSQSMHQTVQYPWPLGRRRPASPKAHRRVNTPYCHIGQPPAIHAEAAAGLSLWSALALQSASCLCTSYGIYHTLRGAWEWRESAGHPHQACMQLQQYRFGLSFIGYTTRLPIICGPS